MCEKTLREERTRDEGGWMEHEIRISKYETNISKKTNADCRMRNETNTEKKQILDAGG